MALRKSLELVESIIATMEHRSSLKSPIDQRSSLSEPTEDHVGCTVEAVDPRDQLIEIFRQKARQENSRANAMLPDVTIPSFCPD